MKVLFLNKSLLLLLGCKSVARLLSFGLNLPGFGKQPSGHIENIVQTSALQKHFVYSVLQNVSYLQTVLIRIMKVVDVDVHFLGSIFSNKNTQRGKWPGQFSVNKFKVSLKKYR